MLRRNRLTSTFRGRSRSVRRPNRCVGSLASVAPAPYRNWLQRARHFDPLRPAVEGVADDDGRPSGEQFLAAQVVVAVTEKRGVERRDCRRLGAVPELRGDEALAAIALAAADGND